MQAQEYLIIDIGSTYTKQRYFSMGRLLASVQVPTSIQNVYNAVSTGRKIMEDQLGNSIGDVEILASSSAAGGLRMVAMGYMAQVTAKAAKEVAMNSGAKILEILSHEDQAEKRIEVLREISPDIILLAGGTDFGDETSLLENSEVITKSQVSACVVLAGNIKAQKKAVEIFRAAKLQFVQVPNIMPTIHQLRVKEARDVIHREFIRQITQAQGLSLIQCQITGEKIIPTPGAVLLAAELLAKGTFEEKGIGSLIVVDLGGATTDVHSVIPEMENLSQEEIGLIVSNSKQISYRTVEGNLGMRVSASGVLETVPPRAIIQRNLSEEIVTEEDLQQYVRYLEDNTKYIAETKKEYVMDTMLARTAVESALKRHSGYISTVADPVTGIMPGMPVGRDLRSVTTVIAVGGIFAHRAEEEGKKIIRKSLEDRGVSLLPSEVQIFIDKEYIFYAAGVIADKNPEYALQVLKHNLGIDRRNDNVDSVLCDN